MKLMEKYGELIEADLNKAINEAVEKLGTDKLKEEGYKLVDQIVDKYIGGKLTEWAMKLKANIVDKIDGQDDIPDV